MKKLPTGIDTFSKLIEGNHLYVDKTAIALDLINQGSYYFLSRPRRFGKSLFLSALKEIFAGNQALFEWPATSPSPFRLNPRLFY